MIIEGLLAVAIGWYMVVRANWTPRNIMDISHEMDMESDGIYTHTMTSRVVNAGQGLPGYVAAPTFGHAGEHTDTVLDRIRTIALHTANSRKHLYLNASEGKGAGGGFSNTVSGTQPDVVPFHRTYTTALPGTSLPGVHPGF